jgi:hypothetical protein
MMSNLNIQWKLGKPLGVLAILGGFAILSQIPIIYHAQAILEAINSTYLYAYIAITIAALIVLTNAEMVLYEALLIRMRSYDIKDYRIPFLTVTIINGVYYLCYFIVYAILNSITLFGLQAPLPQFAFCQMIALLIIMLLSIWYNKRQIKLTFGKTEETTG